MQEANTKEVKVLEKITLTLSLFILAVVYSICADAIIGALWHYLSNRIEKIRRRRHLAPLPKRERRLLLRAHNWAQRYFSYWESESNQGAVPCEQELDRIELEMQPAINACRDAGIPTTTILFFTKGLRPN